MSVWLNRLTVLVYVAIVAVPVAVFFVVGNWPGAWIVVAVALVLVVLSVGSLRARAVLRRGWAGVPAGVVASGAAPPQPPEGGWAEIPRPAPIGQLGRHDGPVAGVAFHPGGRIVASVEREGTLRLWDTADPARPVLVGKAITTECRDVRTVRFSPDGHLLVVAGDGAVLWDVRDPAHPQLAATLAPAGRKRHPAAHAVAFRPDGRLLVTGRRDGMRVWDVTWDPRNPLATPYRWQGRNRPRDAHSLVFTPDGRWLVTDGGNAIVVADAADPTQAVRVARCRAAPGMASDALVSAVHALALHPGGRFLVGVHELVDASDWVAVGCGVVVGWDLSVPHHPTQVLIMVNPADIPGWVHNRRSGPAPVMLRSHDEVVRAIAFHPNGTLLATASLDRTALLWDTEHVPHLTPVAQLGHPHPVTALAFSPDGQILATANGTTTTLWNTTTVKT